MRRAAESSDAFHANLRASDAGYTSAHLLEKLAEFDDVRLGRRVPDLGDPFGSGRSQERRLGARDRRFVEIHRGALQPIGRLQHVIGTVGLPGTHSQQCIEMGGNRAPRWEVASWRSDVRTTDPGEQGSKQQHRAAQPTDKSTVRNVTADGRRAHAKRRRPDAFDGGAQVE